MHGGGSTSMGRQRQASADVPRLETLPKVRRLAVREAGPAVYA